MHKTLCKDEPGLCEEMRPTRGADLLKYLRDVSFKGLTGDEFSFDANGDGPARYNIIHFKQGELYGFFPLEFCSFSKFAPFFLVKPGKYQWIKIGEYKNGG